MKCKPHMLIFSTLILKSYLMPFHCIVLHVDKGEISRDISFVAFPAESGPTHPTLNRTLDVNRSVISRMHDRKCITNVSTKTKDNTSKPPPPVPPQLPFKTRKYPRIDVRKPNYENGNISDTKAQFDGLSTSLRSSARKTVKKVLNTSSNTVDRVHRTISDAQENIGRSIQRIGYVTNNVSTKLSGSLQNLSQRNKLSLNQRSTLTRKDNPFVAVVYYYYNETKHSLELGLDWFENFMSDVLLFYYIQLKFLTLIGVYNSDVKLPTNFEPKTTKDLFYLYIYTKNNFSNSNFKEILKIKEENEKLKKKKAAAINKKHAKQIDESNKEGLDYDPAPKKDKKDEKQDVYIHMPGTIGVSRRICLNVYGYLQEKKFPNNRIPELLNKNGSKQLRDCFFNIANSKNIFLSNVKPSLFKGKDVFHDIEQLLQGVKIDLKMSQLAVEELLQRSQKKYENIMTDINMIDLESRSKCNMCWAIREFQKVNNPTNDSSDMEKMSVLKSFSKKIAKNTKKADNKSYIRSKTYTEGKTALKLNYSTGIGIMFNPKNDSSLLREYFYEFFDFLYIKRKLYELIKCKGKNFQQSASLSNEYHTKMDDLFYLYIRHINISLLPDVKSKHNSKREYNFDKFKKFPIFNTFFDTYIKASGEKNDIYTLLYSAKKLDLEIGVMTEYINRTEIQGELLSKHSNEICPCCIIESQIHFYLKPDHLNKAFQDYETIFLEKVDRIRKQENLQ